MHNRQGRSCLSLLLSLLLAVLGFTPVSAQQGVLTGTVTDAGTGQALPDVQIQALGAGSRSFGSLTDQAGRYRISLPEGSYTLVVDMIGYAVWRIDGVQVVGGQSTSLGVALEARALTLDPIQVTVGKKPEKATQAPATVSVVSEARIEQKVVATPIEHLKDVVGVDIINYGVSAGNVVVRGFNNIFSGAVHFLTDNRIASLPSLQVNLMQFVPSTNEDISRIEVVLGPGSALYGPNTANGVLHFITRSPLEGPGTTMSLAAGERDVFKGLFRTSQMLGEDFGIKVSGSYFRGREWPFADSVEVEALRTIQTDPDAFRAQLAALGLTPAEIDERISRVGTRDYDIERWSGEARADWRFADNGTAILQAGRSSNDGIELTGLGAGQTQDWAYTYYQARMNLGRLFAQTYLNTSDAGDSYLLRQGGRLIDKSKMWVAQIQNGAGMVDDRLDFIYGLDYKRTTPNSEGTIYGQYEDRDGITEFGAYVQAEAHPLERWKLVGALRYDESTAISDAVWSPRAALVFTPDETQSVRFTYNRAFSTPSTLNLFLDINGGRAPAPLGTLGYLVRATGPGPDGLSFQDQTGTLRGMRSPFTPEATGGPAQLLPVDVQSLWQFGVGLLQAQGAIDAQTAQLLAAQDAAAGGVQLRVFDPITGAVSPITKGLVPDAPPLNASITTTYELGYQGVLGGRLALAADVWTSTRTNFTSPLTVWTPLLVLDRTSLQAWLTGVFEGAGFPGPQAAGQAGLLAGGLGGDVQTNRPPAPLAVVSSGDVNTLGADLVTTYVNYGEVDLGGADVSLTAILSPEWSLGVTGSLVSDDHFRLRPSTPGATEQVVALNAPARKGSVTLGYRNTDSGVNAEVRGRFTAGFPANSAGYVGTKCVLSAEELLRAQAAGLVKDCVDSAAIFDVTAGFHIPKTGATAQIYVSNLFNSGYRSFVGVPNIGRLAMLQLKYQF